MSDRGGGRIADFRLPIEDWGIVFVRHVLRIFAVIAAVHLVGIGAVLWLCSDPPYAGAREMVVAGFALWAMTGKD